MNYDYLSQYVLYVYISCLLNGILYYKKYLFFYPKKQPLIIVHKEKPNAKNIYSAYINAHAEVFSSILFLNTAFIL